jgi:hypothetical protein
MRVAGISKVRVERRRCGFGIERGLQVGLIGKRPGDLSPHAARDGDSSIA